MQQPGHRRGMIICAHFFSLSFSLVVTKSCKNSMFLFSPFLKTSKSWIANSFLFFKIYRLIYTKVCAINLITFNVFNILLSSISTHYLNLPHLFLNHGFCCNVNHTIAMNLFISFAVLNILLTNKIFISIFASSLIFFPIHILKWRHILLKVGGTYGGEVAKRMCAWGQVFFFFFRFPLRLDNNPFLFEYRV